MSGDLEDFLKRAAERRQAKATEKNRPPKRVPPQYSDSRSERVPHNPPLEATVVEEVVVAEVVRASQPARKEPSLAERSKERSKERAKERAKERGTPTADIMPAPLPAANQPYERASRSTNVESVGFSAADIIELLKQPGGVQQAILLREILDRPEHRW